MLVIDLPLIVVLCTCILGDDVEESVVLPLYGYKSPYKLAVLQLLSAGMSLNR